MDRPLWVGIPHIPNDVYLYNEVIARYTKRIEGSLRQPSNARLPHHLRLSIRRCDLHQGYYFNVGEHFKVNKDRWRLNPTVTAQVIKQVPHPVLDKAVRRKMFCEGYRTAINGAYFFLQRQKEATCSMEELQRLISDPILTDSFFWIR